LIEGVRKAVFFKKNGGRGRAPKGNDGSGEEGELSASEFVRTEGRQYVTKRGQVVLGAFAQ